MSEKERSHLSDLVISLGGSVVKDSKILDPDVTHLITSKPMRSEKHLVALASGKWVLYKSFIENSIKEGHFVNVSNVKNVFSYI